MYFYFCVNIPMMEIIVGGGVLAAVVLLACYVNREVIAKIVSEDS